MVNCRWIDEVEFTGHQICNVCGRRLRVLEFNPNLIIACDGTRFESGPCAHRGEKLRETDPKRCGCLSALPVFACALKGECTETFASRQIQSCASCNRWSRNP